MKQLIRWMMVLLISAPSLLRANEGMWLISLLNRMNEAEMKGLGLNLTADEIYSINHASLKDAIVRLNYGQCTGEVVSDRGLIFTNHHCGYDAIQSLSTVENNLLVNGFCAKSIDQELPIPGFKIQFLDRIENVTSTMLEAAKNAKSESDREAIVASVTKELVSKYSEGGKFEIEIKSFFFGNEYYMMVYQTFRDIRLVGNPPESVGKFGGDTDNWMWPRHTGDFSMLRIYAGKDNQPADYSKDNVPYKPKHSLPVNMNGLDQGDFTMIMGFPGRTNRYLTSFGINSAVNLRNPALIECFGTKLESWKTIMDEDDSIRLMYAAKYASTANTWKYYIGQNRGLKRLDVQGKKEKIEADFSKWVNSSAERKTAYGSALTTISDYYKVWDPNVVSATYSQLAGLGGAEFMGFAAEMGKLVKQALAETDEAKRKAMFEELKMELEPFFKEFDAVTDKLVFINLTELHRKRVPTDLPTWHNTLAKGYKSNVVAYADKLFASSIFVDRAKMEAFLDKPSLKALEKDLGYQTAISAEEHAMAYRAKNPAQQLTQGMRTFVRGLQEMNPGKAFAPDANSTMRLTYGIVDGYKPADAVSYKFYTTSDGILEKHDDSNPEFVVPEALVKLLEKRDFGRYANSNGELVTCFLHNLDITGGNSGSPVIDGDGNIVGIAFDGNWEAMSGDIAFEPQLQRTISVDIRYVLFIVDKLMGGSNIINELKFAERKPKAQVVIPVEGKKEAIEVKGTVAPEQKPEPKPSLQKK
jgi:hypothetical protein